MQLIFIGVIVILNLHACDAGSIINDTGKLPLFYKMGVYRMLNFEEEIKKFHPSLEIDDAEDAIYNSNVSDITDIMVEMLNELREAK